MNKFKDGSIKTNIILQTLYQVVNLSLPLITTPYLARTLGAAQQGVFSYISSIVAYFTLFAALGTTNYGTRAIAENRSNKTARSQVFWEIYTFQIITSFICLCVYVLFLVFSNIANKLIGWIQIIELFYCLINITWLFNGIENFRLTLKYSFIIRICSCFAILLFVKSPDDLWKYTLIMVGSTFLSAFFLWLHVYSIIEYRKPKIAKIKQHIIPNLILFIPLLAMTVYHNMDKTMLGILSTFEQSGYYYNSDKLISIPVGILSGIGTVLLPRVCKLVAEKKDKEANGLFLLALNCVCALGVALSFGIASISKEFVPFFFGEAYSPCIFLTSILAPVLLIKGLSLMVRNLYLIPRKKEPIFIKSVIIGAVVNLVFNYILIRRFGALGAVIATLLAELSALIVQLFSIRKEVNCIALIRELLIYTLFGLLMLLVVRVVANATKIGSITILIEIIAGCISYSIMCFIYWKKTHNPIISTITSTIFRK